MRALVPTAGAHRTPGPCSDVRKVQFSALLLLPPSQGPQVDQLKSCAEKDRLWWTGRRPSEHSAQIDIEIEIEIISHFLYPVVL